MSSANLQSIAPNNSHIKSLRQVEAPRGPQVQSKALGGSGNAELATWYEQAHSYYSSVMNGQVDQPSETEWNEFINQMNWAYQKLMGSGQSQGWEPNYGEDIQIVGEDGYSQGSFAPSDPFGGIPGTGGQWVHNQEEARVGFLGNQSRDIWANDVTIDVAPLSAKVEVVKVMDESVQPPVEVLKILVTDAATGTQDVYKIYDFDDADIKIRAADPGAVTGADSLGISVEKFKESQAGKGSSQANIEGEAHPTEEDWTIYEGRVGQYAEFYPEGSGEGGPNEVHEIYGDARIFTRPSDHVVVSKSQEGDPHFPDGHTLVIEHRDGTLDTYYIHKGFDVDLHAMPEYTTWDDGTVAAEDLVEGEYDSVPSEFSDHFSLNGGRTSDEEGFASNGGTQPDDFEEYDVTFDGVTETYRTAIYNNSQNQDVTINANLDDDVGQHKVFAPGVVTINPSDYSQDIGVYKSGDTYRVVITDGEKSETIEITGASQIIINGLETNVDLGSLGEEDDVVQVGAEGTTNANQQDEETNSGSTDWPASRAVLHGFIPGTAPNATESRTLINWVQDAMETGDWHRVYANIMSYEPRVANNIIRNFISALYGYAGTREAAINLLKMIPENVRQAMISKVQERTDELDERVDSLFSSSETASLINESITASSSSED